MTLAGSSDTHCSTSSTSSTNSTSKPNNGNGGDSSNQSGKGGGDNNNNSSTNDGDNSNKSSSKTGIIAGIVIAAFFIIFFGLLSWFFLRRRNKRKGGVRVRKGWTIDRNDSLKVSGGRARLPSDPSESDITPFALPTSSHATSPMSVQGYSDIQASPFVPGGSEPGRPSSQVTDGVRGTYYRDYDEAEPDGHNAYAMDAFRTSTAGSGSGSQGRSAAQESSSSRLRVVNEDAEHRSALRESAKSSMTQNASAQQQRQVFQHQDAGTAAIEEIPPAYPGPVTGFPRQ